MYGAWTCKNVDARIYVLRLKFRYKYGGGEKGKISSYPSKANDEIENCSEEKKSKKASLEFTKFAAGGKVRKLQVHCPVPVG